MSPAADLSVYISFRHIKKRSHSKRLISLCSESPNDCAVVQWGPFGSEVTAVKKTVPVGRRTCAARTESLIRTFIDNEIKFVYLDVYMQ